MTCPICNSDNVESPALDCNGNPFIRIRSYCVDCNSFETESGWEKSVFLEHVPDLSIT
jgi:hypothetical protein